MAAELSLSRTRSELKRQYKEAPPPMGVWAIRNLTTGRVVVAASMNVHAAINRARFELARAAHRDKLLQHAWTADASAIHFEVMDTLKLREDPAFDYRAELAGMLALWREELCA